MARVTSVLLADGVGFVSRPVRRFELTFNGVAGDRHAGTLRPADVRTPWHKRGTPIANTRQISILSAEECAEVAALIGVALVDPALLGANMVLSGIEALSFLPIATRLQFPSGATLFVTEQNAPCRHPAAEIAAAHGDPRLAASFVKAALGRRGLVALVECPGEVAVGDEVARFAPPGRVERPAQAMPAARVPALAE